MDLVEGWGGGRAGGYEQRGPAIQPRRRLLSFDIVRVFIFFWEVLGFLKSHLSSPRTCKPP